MHDDHWGIDIGGTYILREGQTVQANSEAELDRHHRARELAPIPDNANVWIQLPLSVNLFREETLLLLICQDRMLLLHLQDRFTEIEVN